MDFLEIQDRMRAILEHGRGKFPEYQRESMIESNDAGEPGMVLEDFCTQIYEYYAQIPRSVLEEIVLLGQEMGIDERYWAKLKVYPAGDKE